MKKLHSIILLLSVAILTMVLVLTSCGDKAKYKITVESEYASECEVGQRYYAGEEVTVKLPTITEHYYSLYINGEEVQMNRDRSDMEYTYFTFIMPECDVTIKIEGHSVDIPEQEDPSSDIFEAPPQEDHIDVNDVIPKKDSNVISDKYNNNR